MEGSTRLAYRNRRKLRLVGGGEHADCTAGNAVFARRTGRMIVKIGQILEYSWPFVVAFCVGLLLTTPTTSVTVDTTAQDTFREGYETWLTHANGFENSRKLHKHK